MWMPEPSDMQTLRVLGGLTMAVVIGVRLAPGLRPYALPITVVAAVLYVAVGLGLFLFHMLA